MANIEIPDQDIFQLTPLGHAYTLLRQEGWSDRQALYMAWKSHPPEARQAAGLPSTQIALFVNVLCLKSDNTVRQWRKKHPDMEERILTIQRQGPLSHYRPMVLHALAQGAIKDDYTPDRRLFLEMTGDYAPSGKLDANLAVNDTGLTVEEWKVQADQRRAQAAATMAKFNDDTDPEPNQA